MVKDSSIILYSHNFSFRYVTSYLFAEEWLKRLENSCSTRAPIPLCHRQVDVTMTTITISGKRKDPPSTADGTRVDDNSDETTTDTLDSLTRVAKASSAISTAGRGAFTGWTSCPLCGDISKKKYSRGRGIANHLEHVHTPWKPSKLAQKIHRRKYEAEERLKYQGGKRRRVADSNFHPVGGPETTNPEHVSSKPLTSWEPSKEEKMAWKATMTHILQKLEKDCIATIDPDNQLAPIAGTKAENGHIDYCSGNPPLSKDKIGKEVPSYRDSLPSFLVAAAQGELGKLQDLVQEAQEQQIDCEALGRSTTPVKPLQNLLDTKDRHKATAEHWAAGGGHLKCLQYLYELRAAMAESTRSSVMIDYRAAGDTDREAGIIASISTVRTKTRLVRRRDGKTCLHYAARNGRVDCLRYLLTELPEEQLHSVDERSGEGTTPLHLACYGGHPKAVKYLVETHGADVHATNDWGCSCAHWVAMTISTSEADVRELCNYLKWECGVSFVERQHQGHSALHKAAQRRNGHVIQWLADPARPDEESSYADGPRGKTSWVGGAGLSSMEKEQAGAPDNGGHRPSDVWTHMGGVVDFANWMKNTMQW